MANIYDLDNSNIKAAAGIKASKLEGEYALVASQTGTVVAQTVYSGPIKGTNGYSFWLGALITETIATGGDRTVDVDLKRSTGAGAFASILSAPIQFTDASTLRSVSTATISTTALVAGDILQIVVTVAGAAGNQALGLAARAIWWEDS